MVTGCGGPDSVQSPLMDLHHDAQRQRQLWDRFALHFDDMYAPNDPTLCVEFLHARAGAGRVLELGAGAGRVAVPLAGLGHDILAVELSKPLAAALRDRAGSLPIEVVVDDIAVLQPTGPFTMAYAVDSTLLHLTEQQRQVDCFRRVAGCLAPEGRFIVETYSPPLDALHARQHLGLAGLTDDLVVLQATVVDTVRQVIRFNHVTVQADGNRVVPIEERYVWPSELDLMGQLAGFELEERWAWFDQSAFTPGSHGVVSVFRLGRHSS